ncbi:SoxR reducing system RseC family protein [Telmatospirillum siberiense]|uniref:Fis family transcriptional regulator n=1 Tax=Telmatospirillum siberiense TaxID=382514 RepID=A0A2N3PMT6_9PROT|nr:SoxR reducing system RseC family protein [Telmatospirillum siberiense]PKU21716.1 Fis family transcriptional regulator [Telmatospirillum siberiense]
MDGVVESVARVISTDGVVAWLEPEKANACGGCLSAGSCSAQGGEPGRRLSSRRFTIADTFHATVGDRIVVGLSEHALLKASATAYAIPLLLMVGIALVGQLATDNDVIAAIGAVAGLIAGLLIAKHRASRLDARGELSPYFLRFARGEGQGDNCPTD